MHARADAATTNQLEELVRLDDGTIVLAGVGISLEAGPVILTSVLTRLRSDGSVDETFGDRGAVVLANQKWPIGVAATDGGQLLVGTTDFSVFRLSGDGTLDTTYGDAGYAQASFPFSAPG